MTMSDLDNDFAKVAEQINAKIKEAAASLQEANRLANEAGLQGLIYNQFIEEDDNSLEDLDEAALERLENDPNWDGESTPLKMKTDLIDVSDLEHELCVGGWSTSSSYC